MSTKLPSDFFPTMSKMHELRELHSTQGSEIQDFPTAVLPPILADMVKEVARITQTKPDLGPRN